MCIKGFGLQWIFVPSDPTPATLAQMSRSVSTFTVTILLLFTVFATFASAAPTNVTCGGLDVKNSPGKVEDGPPVPDTPKVDETNSPTNTTVVDDGTSDDDVVNLDDINTLATATRSGTVRRFSNGRSIE